MFGQGIEVEYLASPLKSENDRKEYRTLKLKNRLTALLISDIGLNESTGNDISESKKVQFDFEENNTNMASCGLCINVGSFNDPTEVQGMAHLLEHVTSAGAEKFLRKMNSPLVANTGRERTIFAFQVYTRHLLSAMDKFAELLIDNTLVDEDTILKERENIDNEFYLDLPSDCERIKQLFRVTMSDENPAAKFSCGNSISLCNEISADELCFKFVEFKEKYYSAHRMTLVVQAKLSLDTLENYVINSFSEVPSNFLPLDDLSNFTIANLFNTTKFRKIYKMKSISHGNQMEMKWVMPPSRHLYRSKPLIYISRVMNHEGRGSLSHYLKLKNLCLSLDVSCEQSSIYSVIKLSFVLSPSGKEKIQEILDSVFSFIKMMQAADPQKKIFDEMQKSAADKFRFTEGVSALKNVQDLCWSMQLHQPVDYITGNDLYMEYDSDAVKQFADRLSCDNLFILLLDENFDEDKLDQLERWYRIRYSSEEVRKDWIDGWKTVEPLSEFQLPENNPFVAADFQLIQLTEYNGLDYPTKILDDGKIEMWYKLDRRLPLCFFYVHLIAAFSLQNINSCVMLRLFAVIIPELVLTHLYDAKCAGLACDISESRDGLIVKVDGFSQKVPILLKILMTHIGEITALITENLFDLVKTDLLKHYSSILLDPVSLASEIQSSILDPNYRTSRKNIDALKRINFPQFLDFLQAFVSKVHVRGFAQGNITPTCVLKTIEESVKNFKCSPLMPKMLEVCNYESPPGDKHYRAKNLNPLNPNSVVLNFYQTDVYHPQVFTPILKQFLEMIMQEQLFRQLRIEEQLSYVVSCFECPGGFSIMLCNPVFKFTTEYVDGRIDGFLKQFINFVKAMSIEEFNGKKEYFVKCLEKGDECLKDEADRNWFAIDDRNLVFNECEEYFSAIRNLKIKDFHKWINDCFVDGKAFRKLSVQVVGNFLNN